jgi:hypothetical protein
MALYLKEIARIVGCTGMDVKLKESGTAVSRLWAVQ